MPQMGSILADLHFGAFFLLIVSFPFFFWMKQCCVKAQPFHPGGVYPSICLRVVFRKFRMCPQVTAILHHGCAHCVRVCTFATGLTLPIKFSVPAVNFIGGVKPRLGWPCIFCLCVPRLSVEITACKDKMHPSIQVCNTDFFDYVVVGDWFYSFLRAARRNFLWGKKARGLAWWDLRDKTCVLGSN